MEEYNRDPRSFAIFRDRRQAGERLGRALQGYRQRHPLILGIPRGGVPVAVEVARALGADVDIVVARKIGAPGDPEFAIGAVTAEGGRFLNTALIGQLGVSPAYLEREIAAQSAEARRRADSLRGGLPRHSLAGRCAIVVDDGAATGATMIAAVGVVRQHRPTSVVVAVPVGSSGACAALRAAADEVVCLHELESFGSVGRYFQDFPQIDDGEVRRLLREGVSPPPNDRSVANVGEGDQP